MGENFPRSVANDCDGQGKRNIFDDIAFTHCGIWNFEHNLHEHHGADTRIRDFAGNRCVSNISVIAGFCGNYCAVGYCGIDFYNWLDSSSSLSCKQSNSIIRGNGRSV